MEKTSKLAGCSFGILGDSYSTFTGWIPEGYSCYFPNPESVADVLQVEQTWWHQLMQRNQMQLLINDSYSGATVCTHVRDAHTIDAAYTERAKHSFSGAVQPQYIFVFGATNDSFLDRAIGQVQYSNWTEQDLVLTLPAFGFVLDHVCKHNPDSVVVTVINTDLKPELQAGMAETAEHYGSVVVKLADIDKQNGHPTALGMQQIADQIEAMLK